MTDLVREMDDRWLRLFQGAEEGVEACSGLAEAALACQRAFAACDTAAIEREAGKIVAFATAIGGAATDMKNLRAEITARTPEEADARRQELRDMAEEIASRGSE